MEKSRQAAIIGINNYQDSNIPKLCGAVNDATEMRRILKEFGEFEIDEAHFLTDDKATCMSIRKAISDVLWKSEPSELALFYFSGHGFKDGYGNGYIAPYDMVKSEPIVYGINMQELKEIILSSPNKQSVLVILDCCYSGIPTAKEKAMPEISASLDSFFGKMKEELKEETSGSGQGKFIFASSGQDTKSRENEYEIEKGKRQYHGVFTYHLIQGLDDKAADGKGYVNLQSLRNYIEHQFKEEKIGPQFFEAGSRQLEQIRIATASRKYEEFIKGKLALAIRCMANRDEASNVDPQSLINAARAVSQVLEGSNNHEEALRLMNEIDESLKKYWIEVKRWFANDTDDLRTEYNKLYSELQKLISRNLNYQESIKLDERSKKLFTYLCDVSSKKIEYGFFCDICGSLNQPGSKSTPSNKRYE